MKVKAISPENCSGIIDVSTNSIHGSYRDRNYIREFNKGKSFTFTKWELFNTYTNDELQQDFVSYKNALLACKKTHTAESEIDLKYDKDGNVIGVNDDNWIYVFSSGIYYNDYYINLEEGMLGPGLGITEDHLLYSNTNSTTTSDIKLEVDLNDEYPKGSIIKRGTPVQKILDAVFSSKNPWRGDGVQIYTPEMIAAMNPKDVPDQYIEIPSEGELHQQTEGSSYINILFSAIRSLQAEVAKMRNAFKYGMYSYNGTDTAMSAVLEDNNTINDEEPLWSIDETDLSEIPQYNVDFEGSSLPFIPKENVVFTNPGKAYIKNEACWYDSFSEVRLSEDPKIFLYLTTSDLDVKFNLNSLELGGTDLEFNLKDFIHVNKVDKYNILFLNSRKVKKNDTYSGNNYIWISISNYETNKILAEGYYNIETKTLQSKPCDVKQRFYLYKTTFKNLYLYKFNIYTKYQDFSEDIKPSTPTDEDYKYRVAHITIRSVKNYSDLDKIKQRLPNNELIWEEANSKLWIKSQGLLYPVGSGGDKPKPESGMTRTEVIELLESMGIVYTEADGELHLSSISDVTFINEDTKKKFKFEVSPKGDLVSTELPEKTLKDEIEALKTTIPVSSEEDIRGFIAKVLAGKAGINPTFAGDLTLNTDRVKIGSFYCPLDTDTKHGCSHGFIELENTSNTDIPLSGCYLHFLHPDELKQTSLVDSLPLKGILKAGSTYLIRCKQYADPTKDSDVFVNVDSYDQEWYINGELLDLTNKHDAEGKNLLPYAFALTYGNRESVSPDDIDNPDFPLISPETVFYRVAPEGKNTSKSKYVYKWYYIDSFVLNASHKGLNKPWALNAYVVQSNSIVKNTFELDPAKQAFQALTTYDSSRYRGDKGGDVQYVNLDKELISFPHSDATFKVSNYTPKSSKCNRNVATDKTKLDLNKPNLVTCAFGIDVYKTRCFNWVSSGANDEFVFIKDVSSDSWKSFESYKTISLKAEESLTFPRRKEFDVIPNNSIYARISKHFPGHENFYTAHKCIIDIVETPVASPKVYTYMVGRKNDKGLPDLEHCSKEMHFTLYPDSYTPRVYQITDQQGFDWIQYQVWAAAAKKLNEQITADLKENIIPVLINTGDMTQNGTRVNEWLDYYNAGEVLFDHLEQMNVVGNNDLCDANPDILGTGDDIGKSNAFYFHVFYCYEINPNEGFLPIIKTDDGIDQYIPSLYYFDFKTHRFIMVNSEITLTTCKTWFKKIVDGNPVNIYTGWPVPEDISKEINYVNGFTTIYSMIYNMLNTKGSRNAIAVCHEMPFTVMTDDSLLTNTQGNYRSFSGTSSTLIGSHMNQLSANDKIGIYWFSRLLEYFKVKLCLGGHKHTYAATLPLRENYNYKVDGVLKNSEQDGSMIMEPTLIHDKDVEWTITIEVPGEGGKTEQVTKNLSKFPIVNSEEYNKLNNHTQESDPGYINPVTPTTPELLRDNTVVYFMCQATGYKLTSNKELPSNYQEFTQLLPKTGKNGSKPDADASQKNPMFGIVKINGNNYDISLIRVMNIFKDFKFNQSTYSTEPIAFNYAKKAVGSRYCEWDKENPNFIISI